MEEVIEQFKDAVIPIAAFLAVITMVGITAVSYKSTIVSVIASLLYR